MKIELIRFVIYVLIFTALHGLAHNVRTPPRRPPVRTFKSARTIKRIDDYGTFA